MITKALKEVERGITKPLFKMFGLGSLVTKKRKPKRRTSRGRRY